MHRYRWRIFFEVSNPSTTVVVKVHASVKVVQLTVELCNLDQWKKTTAHHPLLGWVGFRFFDKLLIYLNGPVMQMKYISMKIDMIGPAPNFTILLSIEIFLGYGPPL